MIIKTVLSSCKIEIFRRQRHGFYMSDFKMVSPARSLIGLYIQPLGLAEALPLV